MKTKVYIGKAIVFPVVMYGYESCTMKKAERRRIYAFELWCWRQFLRVPWTARRSNQSILKEKKPWMFIGKTNAKAEASVLWPPDAKSWTIRKDPDAGKYWGQEEKGATENEMVEWHHQLKGHEFEETLGDNEGQGSLGHKELDATGLLSKATRILWVQGPCSFLRTVCPHPMKCPVVELSTSQAPEKKRETEPCTLHTYSFIYVSVDSFCLCSSRRSHMSLVEAWLRACSAPVTDQAASPRDDTDAREEGEWGLIWASESTPKFSNMFTFTYFKDSKPLLLWFLFSPTASQEISWVIL